MKLEYAKEIKQMVDDLETLNRILEHVKNRAERDTFLQIMGSTLVIPRKYNKEIFKILARYKENIEHTIKSII